VSAITQTPHVNQDAEAAILWGCMSDPVLADEATLLVAKDDFWGHAHQNIFGAITELVLERAPTDPVSVAHKLRAQKKLESVGGMPYLAQLIDGTAPTAHVPHYCKIVATLGRLRRAGDLCATLAAEARQQMEDPDRWIREAEARIYEATRKVKDAEAGMMIGDVAARVYQNMVAASRGEVEQGIKTGFFTLDRQVGGLRGGELWYIAGRPGAGKTSWVVQVAEYAATQGVVVLVYSLEMAKEQLIQRVISRHTKVPFSQCRDGRLDRDQWKRAAEAVKYLDTLPIVIDDAAGLSPRGLRARIRRDHAAVERRKGKAMRLGLVVVDYVQLMVADVAREAKRAEQLAEVSRGLKETSMDTKTCLLALAALKRVDDARKKKAPDMDDLRECGAFEFDADQIMMIHRADQWKEEHEPRDFIADLILRKGRNVGEGFHKANFDGRYTEFTDIVPPGAQEDMYP
jgi:replicative DNA helicase